MSTETSNAPANAPTEAPPARATAAAAFPRKTALALACAVAALLVMRLFHHPGTGLDPHVLRDAASLRLPHPAGSTTNLPVPPIQQASGSPGHHSATPGATPPISPFLIDDSRSLDPFFAALWRLEQHRGGPEDVVTILHYGDSPITADLITGDVRAMLQARFGDAGHGFNLVGKPWAWYGHRDVEISDHGWRALTGVGSMRQGIYGLGGATLVGSSDAHSTFRLRDGGSTSIAELQYLTEPNGGSVTIASNGTQVLTVPTEGDADVPTSRRVDLPADTRTIDLTVSGGPVKLLGLDLRTGRSGVLYDSLGLNGASTTVLSRTLAMPQWAAVLEHAAPALVIINYGTNESSFGAFVRKQYEGELRLAISRVRSALPDVPILIMSPMDRAERAGLNDLRTLTTIPEIVAIQRRVAADTHCGFFDTFNAMGGDGTMARWYGAHPRLVSADFIHPTPQGALIVGKLLVDNLDLGYSRWKHLHGIAATPPSVIAAQRGGLAGSPATPATQEQSRGPVPPPHQLPGKTSTGSPAPQPAHTKPSAAVPEPSPADAAPSDTAPPPPSQAQSAATNPQTPEQPESKPQDAKPPESKPQDAKPQDTKPQKPRAPEQR